MKSGNVPGLMPGADDTFQSYGIGWANASNTPFRLYKHWVHEGGISTPLIARWPKGIARRNTVTHEPGHLIVPMATCVDVSGAAYPAHHAGSAVLPMEGSSLRPAFGGKPIRRDDAIYWEHEGNRAVLDGMTALYDQWAARANVVPWEKVQNS